MTAVHAAAAKPSGTLPIAATIGALGVVYGDIGTSPLYALKEAANAAAHGGQLTPEAILGVVSLILWALITAAKAASWRFWPFCPPVMRCPEPGAPNC